MISQSLIELIEKNAGHLATEWLKDVQKNANTPFCHTCGENLLYERAFHIYRNLGHWLSASTPKQETVEFYKKYGHECCKEGFPLSELIYSFILFRRHLWLYILHVGFLDNAYELHRALELNNRVILFFDRIMHSLTLGYKETEKSKI